MGSRDDTRTSRRESSGFTPTKLLHSARSRGVSTVPAIYWLLFAVPWTVGAILGWLTGNPTRAHVVIITALSLLLPLAWLGAVNAWQVLFWERVPVVGPSGLQHVSTSGPLWEYRKKKR